MSASPNSTPVNVIAENEEQFRDFKLLNAVNDRYGGVIIEITEPMDSALFASLLRASIAQWRHQGKKGVWIKLPIQHANLVEAAVKVIYRLLQPNQAVLRAFLKNPEGFWYHHAEPNYLMLAYWIPESAHTLPANASHRVGIGAFVMNEKREVLVVQENTGRFWGTGVWKFPTGVVDEGEDLCTAAVREVKEETAIDTKFVEVLAFRYEICKQESEIEAAKWMPFDEYAAQPYVKNNDLSKYIADICLAKKERKYSGFAPVPSTSVFSNEKSYMYFNTYDLNGQ
ncbi:hypothetical protein COLO4_31937 [Corchorus olitorius]|uniref:Nudix hydrolase domain-containing protein n=1 Tax=Corchorus olitorius TaxID=93759 RepID=A0A1R3H2W3_9ROSI|nr:hypothetical protein COLO4_31937 [Corchorus olitorius]